MTKKKDPFYMAGTENSGKYIVIAKTGRGRVGVRPLGCAIDKVTKVSTARVRIEPVKKGAVVASMSEFLSEKKGWKQPGMNGEHRFSTLVNGGGKQLKLRVSLALAAVGVGELTSLVINPNAPAWAKELVAELGG